MSENQFHGYIGTYTKAESKGIYKFILDTNIGELKGIELAAHIGSPTYVTISHNNEYLYSVAKDNGLGGIASFSIHNKSGNLNSINMQVLEGVSPCYVSVNRENSIVVAANYHKGTVESYIVKKGSGSINTATTIVEHKGSGLNKERQEKAHAHYANFTPDEKYVVAVDLGIDKVITYKESDGGLMEAACLSVKPGSGPRHLVFHPNKHLAYVMTELSSEIIVLQYDAHSGSFKEKQYISTLPEDYSEESYGSAIYISSDGKFVYAANRGHNSIAVFRVNEHNGELTFIETVSTEGDWPRDFSLDPTERFLIAANEKSNTLTLFSRNELTGKLVLLQDGISAPEPVCVKFLHVKK
ncbi:lactonase family protein [Bacillus mycoides]|uniref:6-phosphogluconolactonase n=1 Tax=Bacillus mycoides TaxID=1405 RepID=A0A3D9VD74_BACMY|nr:MULTISPECIES: lactonase family protein [Bacillus]MBW3495158.1 lactonase family protein [Bacillus sp. FDAARGOS_1420]RBP27385.1 6-phosphogluconolactonase [Bacillus sp. DB-2]REF39427.1 6-phosphogluconolactonase [Bacillus mycoides]